MALPTRVRPSFPHSQSLPSGSFHKPPILIRRQKEWKPQSQRTKSITWITALSYSMKLWAMPCRATQDGRVVLIKCGPLEKGIASHFSILALRTQWTVWKGKKKLNIIQINRKIFCTQGSEESLLQSLYYLKESTDSIESLSKFPCYFSQK